MKKKAMEEKLVIRPIIGNLTHTHFWEGPCRAGRPEDLTQEAEARAADAMVASLTKALEGISPEVELLPVVDARYPETFVVPEETYRQIEEGMDKVDFFLCMGWRIPKLERYHKPVVIMQNGNEGIDFAAYYRSIGGEAYVAMNMEDLNEILHYLWVRKAVACTRILCLSAAALPTFGMLSLIRDPEILRQRYGLEVIKLPFRDIFKYMDQITDEEALPLYEKMLAGSTDTRVRRDYFINDIKYYLAARKMMDVYQCNAFTTACHELCTSEIPQQRKFTPCVCHSLMKDDGIPSGCEEDLNAMMAMCVMQYLANRPAFMGNPNHETDELIRIHHAVPALCMNGYGTKPLEYKLWAFTGQGFGGKLQVDFTQNASDDITLGRFDPSAENMCVTTGQVLRTEYDEVYCSPYYYIQMKDARTFMHNLAGFGHHQVLIFGNYSKELKELSRYMHFNFVDGSL